MRVLLTGATGFVGRHLRRSLAGPTDLWCAARSGVAGTRDLPLDITDATAVSHTLAAVGPQVVVHLAAIAQARDHSPATLHAVNVAGAAHVAESLWRVDPKARFIAVSTGYVYGETPRPAAESSPCAPVGAYAHAKLEMERVVRALGQGRDLCIVRPFNHTGPGQSAAYAVASFAEKLAVLESSACAPVLSVGDLDAVRDLGDVRDLAAALAWLATAPQVPPTLNLGTGTGRRMGDVLTRLVQQTTLDPSVLRIHSQGRSALRASVADATLRRSLPLPPPRPLEDTLAAVLSEARARVSRAGAAKRPAATGPD